MRDASPLTNSSAADPAKVDTPRAAKNTGRSSLRGWLLTALICAAFFAVTAPTLHRLDFFDGVEHINLATVLELRRDGHAKQWLMPELERDPRTVKPPLTAWIAAAPVQTQTVHDLGNPDAATRLAAFDQFVWQCRWPTLVCTCLMLCGVYEMGRVIGGRGRAGNWKLGVLSVLICASCLLLLRQGRRATTDLQLSLWVTLANAFLAKLIVERRRWLGSLGAGVALGLAIMSKGPHIAALQTIVPAGLFALYACRRSLDTGASHLSADANTRRTGPASFVLPLIVGAALAAAIGLWWYVCVLAMVPGVWQTWFHEVTRIQANTMKPDPWYEYGVLLSRFMLPWTAWMFLGIGYAICELLASPAVPAFAVSGNRPENARPPTVEGAKIGPRGPDAAPNIVFALLLLAVPLLVMSLFHERKERYLLPMVGPGAVLAAYALQLCFRAGRRAALLPRIVDAVTWLAIGWLAIGVPLFGAVRAKSFLSFDGTPWFTPGLAASAAAMGAVLIAAGIVAFWHCRPAGVFAIVLAAWLGNEMQLRGYIAADADEDGRSERLLAERLWRQYPDAVVYDTEAPTRYGNLSLPDIVLSLYFDRVVTGRPQALPAEPGGRPLILLTEAPEQRPPAPPSGWRRLEALPLRSGAQYVDVLGSEGRPRSTTRKEPP